MFEDKPKKKKPGPTIAEAKAIFREAVAEAASSANWKQVAEDYVRRAVVNSVAEKLGMRNSFYGMEVRDESPLGRVVSKFCDEEAKKFIEENLKLPVLSASDKKSWRQNSISTIKHSSYKG